ncbi:hypothetical protein BOTCAL_0385g00150 [Botryotinia calthae]|uniref:Uncharacterized protein n=1 Tax=Botryotinia calthae TaxID=38488 RepID=A0A4Y8CRC6_9HELO|nr:hypothetical protein BOTCAL_0385g00150 [Botryotinia calthae]
MPSGSSSNRNPIDNEDRKRKHRESSSVSSGNSNSSSKGHGKKKERTNPPKEEDRARDRWSSEGELLEGVASATDPVLYRNQGNRQPLSDGPSPPHTPSKLERKRPADSFSSLSETQSEKIRTDIKAIRMEKGWLDPNISQYGEGNTQYDLQIEEAEERLRQLQRG